MPTLDYCTSQEALLSLLLLVVAALSHCSIKLTLFHHCQCEWPIKWKRHFLLCQSLLVRTQYYFHVFPKTVCKEIKLIHKRHMWMAFFKPKAEDWIGRLCCGVVTLRGEEDNCRGLTCHNRSWMEQAAIPPANISINEQPLQELKIAPLERQDIKCPLLNIRLRFKANQHKGVWKPL